jgi:ornithine cyclodeaminase
MIVLTERQTLAHATLSLAFDAVAASFISLAQGSATVNPVVIGQGVLPSDTFAIKSGVARGARIVGLKVGSYWPGNEAHDLPRHSSSVLLLDPDTGVVMAVVQARGLNGLRTAAADAVAAVHLARPDSETLTVVGAGHQAAHEVRAICAVLPIKRVLISSQTATRATALRDRVRGELPVEASVVDVEQGAREADVLVTVTPSKAPLFEDSWIAPGTHVASMGSDQVGKQEIPPKLLTRARLFCDLPSQSLTIGEFQHVREAVQSGSLRVTAIGSVLVGDSPGRESREDITVFDSSGVALQDLFVASRIIEAELAAL